MQVSNSRAGVSSRAWVSRGRKAERCTFHILSLCFSLHRFTAWPGEGSVVITRALNSCHSPHSTLLPTPSYLQPKICWILARWWTSDQENWISKKQKVNNRSLRSRMIGWLGGHPLLGARAFWHQASAPCSSSWPGTLSLPPTSPKPPLPTLKTEQVSNSCCLNGTRPKMNVAIMVLVDWLHNSLVLHTKWQSSAPS